MDSANNKITIDILKDLWFNKYMNEENLRDVIKYYSNIKNSIRYIANILNQSIIEGHIDPIESNLEDMLFIKLFGHEYFKIHDMFSTPGNIRKGQVILWDNENGGYPPERLLELISNPNPDFIQVIKQIKLIKQALKKQAKKDK